MSSLLVLMTVSSFGDMFKMQSAEGVILFPGCTTSDDTHFLRTVPHTTQLFILLTTQRSGSSWVSRDVLPSQTHHCAGEMLLSFGKNNQNVSKDMSWENFLRGVNCGYLKAHKLWKDRLRDSYNEENACGFPRVMGFKLMYNQIPAHLRGKFFSWIAAYGIKVLHLCRKASLLVYASQTASRSGGGYHNLFKSEVVVDVQQTDTREQVAQIITRLRQIEQQQSTWHFYLVTHRVTNLHVWYEDLMYDDTSRESVYTFLDGSGVSSKNVVSVFRESIQNCTIAMVNNTYSLLHSSKCSDRVSNYTFILSAMQNHYLRTEEACTFLESV
eukprot:m.261274 g.261274  ORF g.261274 m.261274 type:complete len:327 (-) comp41789_c0_seq1:132-1112(-)